MTQNIEAAPEDGSDQGLNVPLPEVTQQFLDNAMATCRTESMERLAGQVLGIAAALDAMGMVEAELGLPVDGKAVLVLAEVLKEKAEQLQQDAAATDTYLRALGQADKVVSLPQSRKRKGKAA